jgi:hypothetical protein
VRSSHAAANSSCAVMGVTSRTSTQIMMVPVGTAIGAAIEAWWERLGGERRTGALWKAGQILRVTICSTGVPLPVTSESPARANSELTQAGR